MIWYFDPRMCNLKFEAVPNWKSQPLKYLNRCQKWNMYAPSGWLNATALTVVTKYWYD